MAIGIRPGVGHMSIETVTQAQEMNGLGPDWVRLCDYNPETIAQVFKHLKKLPMMCQVCGGRFWTSSTTKKLPAHYASRQTDVACAGSCQPAEVEV